MVATKYMGDDRSVFEEAVSTREPGLYTCQISHDEMVTLTRARFEAIKKRGGPLRRHFLEIMSLLLPLRQACSGCDDLSALLRTLKAASAADEDARAGGAGAAGGLPPGQSFAKFQDEAGKG